MPKRIIISIMDKTIAINEIADVKSSKTSC